MTNSASDSSAEATQPRILLAEDEGAIREFIIRGLSYAGYEVTGVADGIEALEELARGPYDLLISDIVMPRLDGISLALKVSESYPATSILMITGYAAEKQRAHNLEFLIHDVLSKPFTLDEITQAVERSLSNRAKIKG
jgi:DNA-binding response OmpR family regulator